MKRTLNFNTINEFKDLITNPNLKFPYKERSHEALESALANIPIGSFTFNTADNSEVTVKYYEESGDFYSVNIKNKDRQMNIKVPHHTLLLGYDIHEDEGSGEVEFNYDKNDPKYLQGWIEFTPGDLQKVEIGNPETIKYAYMSPVFSIHFEKFYFTKG